ncbi:MAG: F0F1 ATP synthase subunit B' [Pseudomonadota bacterium]|nr:F0F1 ATP synthase subunit B' [Pseudomonadota bacterium]
MPQLEQLHTYISQVFWLVITFGILYVVLWKSALPRISKILQDRQERIDDDLREAERFKKEAEEAIEAYSKLLADARSEVQAVIRAENEKLATDTTVRHGELTEKIKADVNAAEARIANAREVAIDGIRAITSEVAQAATARLIGTDVSSVDAEMAVSNVMREKA